MPFQMSTAMTERKAIFESVSQLPARNPRPIFLRKVFNSPIFGFNTDLTGRETVYLNGALLGFSNQEIDDMYDEIVKFAELENFMDQKLKNFSSGMQVRLAFSIAIKAQGDILVLDEVLAVGDEAFQNKCNQFFNKIKKDATKTVVLVTHSMENVRKYCNHAILIRNGVITIDGSPEDVANSYSLENTERYSDSSNTSAKNSSIIKNLKVTLKSPEIINQNHKVRLNISYDTDKNISTHVAITLWDIVRSQSIINSNSRQYPTSGKKHHSITFETKLNELNDINIRAYVSVRDQNNEILTYSQENESPTFIFRRSDYQDPKNKTTNAVLFNRGEYLDYEK